MRRSTPSTGRFVALAGSLLLSWVAVADAGPVGDGAAAEVESLFRSGRLVEAERAAAGLAALDSPPPRALLVLARLRAARGRYADASELARRALRAAPDDPQVLYWSAGLVGDRDASIELLSRFIELGDGDPDRVESARGSRELLLALGERRVWWKLQAPPRVELPLRRLRGPHGGTQGYVVEIRLPGRRRPVPVLLDTGSSGLFLLEKVARRGGFEPLASETVFGGGGDQRHHSRRGTFSRVSLGGLVFADATATVTDQSFDPDKRYLGVLGIVSLGGYRVTLDLERERLLLERLGTAADPAPGEGGGEAAGDEEPFWMIAGHLLVRARANGDRSRLFLLDTGASLTVLDGAYAASLEEARVGEPAAIRGYGGRRRAARNVEGVRVEFAGRETPAGPLGTVDLTLRNRLLGLEIAGYLGLDALDGSRIVVDMGAATVRLVREAR